MASNDAPIKLIDERTVSESHKVMLDALLRVADSAHEPDKWRLEVDKAIRAALGMRWDERVNVYEIRKALAKEIQP